MSDEFTREQVLEDLREGAPSIRLVVEQNVVKIVGWQLVYVDLDELKSAVDRLVDCSPAPLQRSALRKIKDLLLRPFSWFVVALLSRDLTPDDEFDDER